MTEETTNLPEGGSDNFTPSDDLNNPANWNFAEPELEEAEANQEDQEEGLETDSETDEAEEGQEAESDDDESEADDEPSDEAGEAQQVIELNGEKVPLEELKNGYLRQADYTRKTQEISTEKKNLAELTGRITQTVEAVADFLSQMVPNKPDPSLAMNDPGEYVRQMAMYEQGMAQVNAIIEMSHAPKEVGSKLSEEQQRQQAQAEFEKLAEAFPEVRTKDGMERFNRDYWDVGTTLGFSQDELRSAMDHRYYKLAYYAKKGMDAEKAQKVVKEKVQKAPPVTAKKRAKGTDAQRLAQKQDAMRRLEKSGSIHDAVKVLMTGR